MRENNTGTITETLGSSAEPENVRSFSIRGVLALVSARQSSIYQTFSGSRESALCCQKNPKFHRSNSRKT